jgi:hypothetical protein
MWLASTPEQVRFRSRQQQQVQRPSQTPVFTDGMSFQTWPSPTDYPSSDLYGGETSLTNTVQTQLANLQVLTIARHGSRSASTAPRNYDISQRLPGAINLDFLDGHTEKSPLENLWNYYWSVDWQVPSPRPGKGM